MSAVVEDRLAFFDTKHKMSVVKGSLETTTAEFKAVSRTLVILSLVPEQTFYFIEQVFYDFKSF